MEQSILIDEILQQLIYDRDTIMQQLVAKDKEPITPFIDVAKVFIIKGISTILAAGSSETFDIAI